jgi:hypothetical protein
MARKTAQNGLKMTVLTWITVLFLYTKDILVYSQTVFTPALSTECAMTLSSIVLLLEPQQCGPILSDILTVPQNFTLCSAATDYPTHGYNCFNSGYLSQMGQVSHYTVPVYRLLAGSKCNLCTANEGMKTGCKDLLTAISSAVYVRPIDYSVFGITDPVLMEQIRELIGQASIHCVRYPNRASVQVLQYQSEVLCASSDTFGMQVSSAGNIDGIVDLRSMTQCGQCAVVPCSSGESFIQQFVVIGLTFLLIQDNCAMVTGKPRCVLLARIARVPSIL